MQKLRQILAYCPPCFKYQILTSYLILLKPSCYCFSRYHTYASVKSGNAWKGLIFATSLCTSVLPEIKAVVFVCTWAVFIYTLLRLSYLFFHPLTCSWHSFFKSSYISTVFLITKSKAFLNSAPCRYSKVFSIASSLCA